MSYNGISAFRFDDDHVLEELVPTVDQRAPAPGADSNPGEKQGSGCLTGYGRPTRVEADRFRGEVFDFDDFRRAGP
jgi:hypothetical protein